MSKFEQQRNSCYPTEDLSNFFISSTWGEDLPRAPDFNKASAQRNNSQSQILYHGQNLFSNYHNAHSGKFMIHHTFLVLWFNCGLYIFEASAVWKY